MRYDSLRQQVKMAIGCESLSAEDVDTIDNFIKVYKVKWENAHRYMSRFEKQNENWLTGSINFSSKAEISTAATPSTSGRKNVDFAASSDRSKRRKTETLRSTFTAQELSFAAQMQHRAKGELDVSNVIKEVVFSTPARAKKYKKAYYSKEKPIPLSSGEALSLVVEAKLTKFQYNTIRDSSKEHNANIYPNYEAVTQAKKRCYPSDLIITESLAEVPLQNLLDHTITRLSESLKEVLKACNHLDNLCFISKWGCDGSSGLSEYKQRFTNPTVSDASIFLPSLVPIQLISGDPDSDDKVVIWQNPRTSSTRYCRPIRMKFVKETTKLTKQEVSHIENQIASLAASKIEVNENEVCVKHKTLFTMIDGKISNAVSENSSTQICYLCGLSSKDFNNIDLASTKDIDKSKFRFGLSSLHAWIRFFESLLHLAYKLPIRQWQARGEDNKQKVAEQKKKIQEAFRLEMGLLVDKPKPGFGSSNDGNIARRFF
ncbi:uncharacterized protein LOC126735653 [Anthonomus grandis grandis]|uniref:uncharacterized protein LOC126735653 n=1 Tax=Anthonomus grandis grandis TaxID=2921223 RepID=UPI0021657A9B|nr:uncharacterized protein LOC126735653 [Anthonomus grandis grandis]XP_050295678.1 uncharacterized protein LOC126735653 [Anthonomus grandis grandis]